MSGVRKSERKNPQRDLPPKPSPSYDEVKKKFGMENMTIEELTVFLRHTSRWLGTDLTTKSVKNYIKTICDHSDGLLRPDDFKENPENPKRVSEPSTSTLLPSLALSSAPAVYL